MIKALFKQFFQTKKKDNNDHLQQYLEICERFSGVELSCFGQTFCTITFANVTNKWNYVQHQPFWTETWDIVINEKIISLDENRRIIKQGYTYEWGVVLEYIDNNQSGWVHTNKGFVCEATSFKGALKYAKGLAENFIKEKLAQQISNEIGGIK